MKILYLVDLHGRKSIIDSLSESHLDTDVVVFGGDITNFESAEKAKTILRYTKEIFKKPVLFVPGNCDDPKLLKYEGEEEIIPLHLNYIELNNIKFFGIGGSNITPFQTYIEFSEEEIEKMLENFKDKEIDVFVTHIPPYNTKVDRIYSGRHVGSQEIRKFIEEKQPKVVLTGHIHEGYGQDRIKNSLIVNPGPASTRKIAILEFSKKIDVKIITI